MATILKAITAFLSAFIVWFTGLVPGYETETATFNSITKVNDYLYVMDCQYDYDLEEMIERGQYDTIDLLLYNLVKVALGDDSKVRQVLENIPYDEIDAALEKAGQVQISDETNLEDVFEKAQKTGASFLLEGMKKISSLDGLGFACTTFNSVNEDGEYIFSRNFDYMPAPSMLVWTHPENGYASMGMVNLGLFQVYSYDFLPEDEFSSLLALLAPHACVDGINEKGLSIGVLEIEKDPTFQFTSKKDITTTGMIRLVLDKAATVDEAIEIFSNYDMRDFFFGECTYHYQIADAQGNSAIIEYIDNEMVVIRPEEKMNARVDYQVATNFILSYKNGVWDEENDPLGMGEDRYQTAMTALDNAGGVLNEEASMDVLEACSMYQQDLHGYVCDTLWSSVYNTSDCTLDLVVGLDYDNPLHFSIDEPCIVK